MELHSLLISLMVVAAIIMGAGTFMVDVTNNYGISINETDETFQNTFDVMNDTYDITRNINVDIANKTGIGGIVQDVGLLFWGSGRTLLKIPNLFNAIIQDSIILLSRWLAIPKIFTDLIIFSVFTFVAFKVLSMMMKWRL